MNTDIPLKREDFFKMNDKIDKEILNQIYEEIYISKLDIIHECMFKLKLDNELIYRRLNFKENLQSRETNFRISLVKDNQKKNLDDYLLLLKQGETFIKYGRKGNSHFRFIKLTKDEDKIIWKKVSTCSFFSFTHYIATKDVLFLFNN